MIVKGEDKEEYVWNTTLAESKDDETDPSQSSGLRTPGSRSRTYKAPLNGNTSDVLEELSGRVAGLTIPKVDHYHRIMYCLDAIQTNMARKNAAMMDFFEHLDYTPRRPFTLAPIWPHDEPTPPGYPSWDAWLRQNGPGSSSRR